MLINAKDILGTIRPEIYGHFSEHLGRCVYGGIFVGEDSPIPNEKGIRKDVNENWGCGGEMSAEDYAREYRRYQAFCRDYNGNHLSRIACGPSSADYGWTETLMKFLSKGWGGYPLTAGIDLHYYTMPIHPQMDSATDFDDKLHYATMDSAFFVDELITRHTEIMNRYDPEGKVGLVIGEWGCWHQVEPGTNPAFLYQQNAMRDALVAAIELNIFNRHAKRMMMANLAQTVNVLQSILLTEGDQLVKTPTYHVFDLFKGHQDGTAVYCYTDAAKAAEEYKAPMVSSSASIKEKVMTITLANCSLTEETAIECDVCHFAAKHATAQILTAATHAFNDFDHPGDVVIKPYTAEYANGQLKVILPPCSVVTVALKA